MRDCALERRGHVQLYFNGLVESLCHHVLFYPFVRPSVHLVVISFPPNDIKSAPWSRQIWHLLPDRDASPCSSSEKLTPKMSASIVWALLGIFFCCLVYALPFADILVGILKGFCSSKKLMLLFVCSETCEFSFQMVIKRVKYENGWNGRIFDKLTLTVTK